MQIRKSRLKQIIQEEVANAKFIDISEEAINQGQEAEEEDAEAASAAAPVEFSQNITLDELIVQEISKTMEGLGDFAPSSDPLENIKTRLKNKNMNPDNDMEAEVKDELANHPHLRDKILTFYYGELADINKRKMQRDTSDAKGSVAERKARSSQRNRQGQRRSLHSYDKIDLHTTPQSIGQAPKTWRRSLQGHPRKEGINEKKRS